MILYFNLKLLLFLFSFSSILFAQSSNEEIKKLEEQWLKQEGIEQIETLKELSWLYLNTNPKRAMTLAQDGLAKLKSYDEPKLKATLLNVLAVSLTYMGYYGTALEKHFESLRLREELKDSVAIASSLNNIGLVYQHVDNTAEAIVYFNKALEYKYKLGDKSAIVISLNNLGSTLLKTKKFKESEKLFKEALAITRDEQNIENLALTLSNLGRFFYMEMRYDSALFYAENSLLLRQKMEEKFGIAEQHLEVGKIYHEKMNFRAAEENYQFARKLAIDGAYYPLLRDVYFQLYVLNNNKHNDKESLNNFKKYTTLKEMLTTEVITKKLEEVKQHYNQEKNLLKIRQLKLDIRTTFLYYIIALSAILFIAGAIITNRYRIANKLKKALEERESFNHALISNLPEYVIVHKDGKIVFTNKILRDNFGIEENKYESINMLDFVTEEYKKKVIENMFRRKSGEQVEEYEADIRDKNGSLIRVVISSSIISYHNSNAILVVMNDITSRKKAELEILKSKEHAEKSDRLKSEFLAQVSHEIRTPLHVILSWISLLQDELQDKAAPELLDGFYVIKNQGARTIRTIDLILNMSELQLGTYEVYLRELDIHEEILLKLYGDLSSRAKQKKLSFNINTQTNHTRTIADEYSVYQIFLNLIENAIKYTNVGSVNILIGRDENDNLFVSISDTGIGISEEYMPRLFQPFSQEQQGYSREFEGNGLGLALVQKYCELNKAEIKVKSKKGEGTEFKITFQTMHA